MIFRISPLLVLAMAAALSLAAVCLTLAARWMVAQLVQTTDYGPRGIAKLKHPTNFASDKPWSHYQ
jgi:hypothetical protein